MKGETPRASAAPVRAESADSARHAGAAPAIASDPGEGPSSPHGMRPADAPPPHAAGVLGLGALLVMLPVTLIVPGLKESIADRFAVGMFWTHAFMSVNMVGAILSAPLIAWICDRGAPRMRIAALAVLLDGAALLAISLSPNYGLALLLRFGEGFLHCLALTALMAAAADAAEPARRGRMMGVVGACMMLGTAVGTGLGGFIWKHVPGRSFEAAALAALVAAVFVALGGFDTARRAAARPPQNWLPLVRRHRGLLVPYLYTFGDRLCVGVIVSTFVLFLAHVHGLPPQSRGALLAMFMVPFALLVYPAGRLVDRAGSALPVSLGSAAFGLLFAAYGVLPSSWLAPAMVLSGVVSAIMFAPTLTLCAELAPPESRGAAYTGFNAAGSLGFMLGPLLGGGLMHFLSPPLGELSAFRATLAITGATQIVCVVVTVPSLLQMRRRM